MKGANSFFLKGKSKKGVLLIHGFTATPEEMRGLGEYLHKRKITVYAPLLSGHGTVPEQLLTVKYDAWIHDVQKALKVLEGSCDEVYVVGNSFGGNLAFLVGRSSKVKAIISMAAPFLFKKNESFGKTVLFALKYIKLFQKKKHPKKIQSLYQRTGRKSYDQIPLYALVQLLRSVEKSRQILPKIRKPVLLMQSTTDGVVAKESVEYVYNKIKSAKKKIYWVKDSIHVFIVDKKCEEAFKVIYKFIKKV